MVYMVLQNNDRRFNGQKIYILSHQHLHFEHKIYNDVHGLYDYVGCQTYGCVKRHDRQL